MIIIMTWKVHLIAGIVVPAVLATVVYFFAGTWLEANGHSIFWFVPVAVLVMGLFGWIWMKVPAHCPFAGCDGDAFQKQGKPGRGVRYACKQCGRAIYMIKSGKKAEISDHSGMSIGGGSKGIKY